MRTLSMRVITSAPWVSPSFLLFACKKSAGEIMMMGNPLCLSFPLILNNLVNNGYADS
jgi:hypothetical protein